MFEINGQTYSTDDETIEILRSIIESAKAGNDSSAVMAVLFLGLHTGRIVQA